MLPKYSQYDSVTFYGKNCLIKRVVRYDNQREDFIYDLIDIDQTNAGKVEAIITNVPQSEID